MSRLIPLLLALSGCNALLDAMVGDLRQVSTQETSGSAGEINVSVDVAGEAAVLLTAQTSDGSLVFIQEVVDPSGNTVFSAEDAWNDSAHSVTMGVYPFPTSSLNWPIDGSTLAAGNWQFLLGVVDSSYYYQAGVPVQVDLLLKNDASMSSGAVHINLVYAGAASADTELARAMVGATAHWQTIYAEMGITVTFEEWTYDNGDLPGPGLGNAEDFRAIAASTEVRSVNVVLVPQIQDGDGLYGMAGGIPGPLVSTDRTAVVISALTSSGPDLTFSDEEERILAETMAHEVGHYLGLFHPVEMTWDTWDSLSDTPSCSGESNCETSLGSNLMFPYPVCSYTSCVQQGELTAEQSSVANSHVVVE